MKSLKKYNFTFMRRRAVHWKMVEWPLIRQFQLLCVALHLMKVTYSTYVVHSEDSILWHLEAFYL